MASETKSKEAACWHRVREAISERWPDINRDELAECEESVANLTQFVKQRVKAADAEVESVVLEFAPQETVLHRVAQAASDGFHDVAESAQFAYMRSDECISRRPTESVLTSFAAGIILGVTVTALWMRSTPNPSVWDRVKSRPWS